MSLLEELAAVNLKITLQGTDLVIRPASRLTPELRERLRARKGELVAALTPLGRVNDRGELVMTREDLPELERRLRSYGWQVERRGDQLVCQKRRSRLKRKAEGEKVDPSARSVPAPPALPPETCYACGGREFWVSLYGVVICVRCHPPAGLALAPAKPPRVRTEEDQYINELYDREVEKTTL
jgi:hypothetical protein